jgi:hypothetical protein
MMRLHVRHKLRQRVTSPQAFAASIKTGLADLSFRSSFRDQLLPSQTFYGVAELLRISGHPASSQRGSAEHLARLGERLAADSTQMR